MRIAQYTFWACLLLIGQTYFFYPVVLFILYSLSQIRRDFRYLAGRRNRRTSRLPPSQLPTVTVIIPAFDEQACLPRKIVNLRQIKYPPEKLEIIIVSDGSTDRTNEILGSVVEPGMRAILLPNRKGKANALNVAVSQAQHEILVFSDASTVFATDAVGNLTRHFSNPRIGVVCGALEFERTSESQQTEGIYWKYESMLRLMEARLGATLTASGAIFALRRSAYRPLLPSTVIEDFVIPMNARDAGYEVHYDPEAIATDIAASSVSGEFTRRVRLAMGSFRALNGLLQSSLSGFAWLAFISHKLLRWLLPFFLLSLLISSAFLLDGFVYRTVFLGQLLFLAWGCVGFVFRNHMRGVRFALMGYFLLAMNVAFLVGFFRFLLSREEGIWQRVS